MPKNRITISESQRLMLNTYTKLMRAANAVTRAMHPFLTDYDLTLSQFGVLEALYSLGSLHQKELGNKILKSDGNITLVIYNLQQRGLIQRKQDPADRRFINVRLAKKGRALMEELLPIHLDHTDRVFSSLSLDRIEELGRLLKTIGTQIPDRRDAR
jgi:MarR family transcriptional regulator, 2-MHQ and catechol-resistance regulon repressor